MPIYAYRCTACGYEKDVLQKMSDAPLTQCPECGKDTFDKQITAAGFQLKGSGWYVTDFRGGNQGKAAAGTTAAPASGATSGATTAAASGDAASGATSSPGPASSNDASAAGSGKTSGKTGSE